MPPTHTLQCLLEMAFPTMSPLFLKSQVFPRSFIVFFYCKEEEEEEEESI